MFQVYMKQLWEVAIQPALLVFRRRLEYLFD